MECTVSRLLTTEQDSRRVRLLARETALSSVFRAKAVVLATGGIARCFRIHSNSWECTGDRTGAGVPGRAEPMEHGVHAVSHRPGWSGAGVRGTLITEGVRGEGGTLRNKGTESASCFGNSELTPTRRDTEPRRQWLRESTFVWERRRRRRRTPDLLPRDIVARADPQRSEAGRVASRRSVSRHPLAPQRGHQAEVLRWYHQFKSWATSTSPRSRMEVGPTAHYTIGGIRVDPESKSRASRALRGGECSAGMPRRDRLVATRFGPARVRSHRGPTRAKYA